MRALILIISTIILISFGLGANPPVANEQIQNNMHDHSDHNHTHIDSEEQMISDSKEVNYTIYNATIWTLTGKQDRYSQNDKTYTLDAGTTTIDGNMHIRVSSDNITSKMKLNNIYVDRNNTMNVIVNETENSSDKELFIDISNYRMPKLNNVSATINNINGTTIDLKRDACGCVMKKDPRLNETY